MKDIEASKAILWKYFFALFLPVLLLLMLAYFAYKDSAKNQIVDEITRQHIALNGGTEKLLQSSIEKLQRDLDFITRQIETYQIESIHEHDAHLDEPAFIKSIKDLMRSNKGEYFQMRILNTLGQETLRIDWLNGDAIRLADNALQDKSDRYYFFELLKLRIGANYISPIDLNVEKDQVEQPLRPTIRMGTKLPYNKGLLVINVDVGVLYQRVLADSRINNVDLWLVNQQGYWLLNSAQNDMSWGHVIPERELFSLPNMHKDVWDYLLTHNLMGDQIHNVELPSGIYSITGNNISLQENGKNHGLPFVITVTDQAIVNALLNARLSSINRGLGFLFMLLMGLAYWLARMIWLNELRKRQIAAALKEAETSLAFKSTFMANMSHEIRTPLNAIIGMLFLMDNDVVTRSQREQISKMHTAANHLLGIINDILDLSKIEAGMLNFDIQDFHLHGMLDNVTSIARSLLSNKPISLHVYIDEKIPLDLRGDVLRISQVLQNLYSNAIKFTERGSVVLRLSAVSITDKTATIQMSISDTGIGMSPETLAKILQPFTQADATITRKYGGTGLGMSIVENLVAMMGGTVSIQSEVNVGTTVSVVLTFDRALTCLSFRPYKDVDLSTLRIMIIDDDANSIEAIKESIAFLGAKQVVECTKTHLALERLDTQKVASVPFDIVFVNFSADRGNGLRSAKQIKQDYPNMHVIVVADAQNERLVADAAKHQMINAALLRPLTPSNVFDNLNVLIYGDGASTRHVRSDGYRLQGIRILLVEDNQVNQEVAAGILRREHGDVVIANNGQEAIDKLYADSTIDVVLMDMQMPVIDGVEASKQIRQDRRFEKLPIIAMTANVMPEDIKVCREAGMNAHTGKPINPTKLYDLICLHTGKSHTLNPVHPVNHAPINDELIDWARIHMVFGNELEDFQRLLEQLFNEIDDFLNAASKSPEISPAMAHSLKGGCANLGLLTLHAYFANLEELSKHGRPVPEDMLVFIRTAVQGIRDDVAQAMAKV